MDKYVKARILYLLYNMLAMEAAGDRRDIYHILFEPHDGLHHSHTYDVHAAPEFSDIFEESNETANEPNLKGENDNGIS